ncbi:MAG TPA: AarF/ABC1/UbiB kinase family protein [Terriglobales bacterium]|nr:AarF/ABC1/UbiB kinase family protein [Terriglobales bacterium]
MTSGRHFIGFDEIKRLNQILRVLARNGFGSIADSVKIRRGEFGNELVQAQPRRRGRVFPVPTPERVRKTVEQLGPTFIKFGQILSTRFDLLPREYCQELEKLQDDVPPFGWAEVQEIVSSELGKPVSEAFRSFAPSPVAAASISQVHRAELPDGRQVAVKVQRPGIERTIRVDLEIFATLAKLVDDRAAGTSVVRFQDLADELRISLNQELDFVNEASNIRRIGSQFESSPTVVIPRAYPESSTKRVLTMDWIDGIKISSLQALDAAGLDRHALAVNGANAYCEQIFVEGLFHADPHPGNIVAMTGNRIALLDFGSAGHLYPEMRSQFAKMLEGVARREVPMIVDAAQAMGTMDERTDPNALQADIEAFIDKYYVSSLEQLRLKDAVTDFLDVLVANKITVARDVLLLARTLAGIEGVVVLLDPKFSMAGVIEPFAEKLAKESHDPKKIFKDLVRCAEGFYGLLLSFPREMQEIMTKVRLGRIRVEFQHRGLENLIEEADRASNRLSFSLVIAAITIASAIVINTDKGPKLWGLPAFGLFGFLAAGVLGLGLLVSILRSRRL